MGNFKYLIASVVALGILVALLTPDLIPFRSKGFELPQPISNTSSFSTPVSNDSSDVDSLFDAPTPSAVSANIATPSVASPSVASNSVVIPSDIPTDAGAPADNFIDQGESATDDGPKVKPTLVVFCAAGMRLAFDEVAKSFKSEYGVEVVAEYRGSGHLLASLELQVCDLFIAADASYTDTAVQKGLVQETIPLAIQYPVIAVQKGNPKNIQKIEDLINPKLIVSSADDRAASMGKLLKKAFTGLGLWDNYYKNTEAHGTFKPTITEVANDLRIRSVDAAILWNHMPKQANFLEHMDFVEDARLSKLEEVVTVGVATKSNNPGLALMFARYLHASEKGQKVFARYNYKTIADADSWSEKPELQLMSGGLNRLAIQETLKEFEAREGVKITTVYNGCGILVGQMKAGQRPDAYYACDTSFMVQVQDLFEEGDNLSSADIIIAVPIANEKGIKSIDDLSKPGIRVGVTHPQQSALGALTKNMLTVMGKYDDIRKNIVTEQPSADMVVAQLVTGTLDAAILYTVNVSRLKDKTKVIAIDHKLANAIQPFAVAKVAKSKYMAQRLLKAIKSHPERFNNNGYIYLGDQSKDVFKSK